MRSLPLREGDVIIAVTFIIAVTLAMVGFAEPLPLAHKALALTVAAAAGAIAGAIAIFK